jgi:hypothetical protein
VVTFGALIVPIVVSAVLVFIASAVIWMVGPHHKKEWSGLSNEESVRVALGAQKLPPGLYMVPFASSEQVRKDPAFLKKLQEGPRAFVTIGRNVANMSMGPMMIQSIVYYLVVSAIVAYVAAHVLAPGTAYLQVFRVVGTIAWLAYGFGVVPESIWFSRPWSSTVMQLFDAFVYALLTAGTFGWRWPH